MASSLTQFDAFLKERYTKDKIENLTCQDRPLYAMVSKDPNVSGDVFVEPILHGNPQGHGATLAKAQAGAQQSGAGNSSISKKWQLTFGDYSSAVEIGDKVIKASRDNFGSFLRNRAVEVDGLWNGFADTMANYMYRNSGRALCKFTESSGVCTLVDSSDSGADDIVNIEEGMILVVSANDGSDSSHTLISSSAVGYVVAVNHEDGKFTVSATSGGSAGTPTNWTGTMYGFRDGDFGGSGANTIFVGLGGFIPSSAPGGSDSFYGVNRSVNDRLSGVRLPSADLTGKGIEQRLKLLGTRMRGRFVGPGPDCIFVNPEKWQELADDLEVRGTRDLGGTDAQFNFDYISMACGGKKVKIYGDPFCPLKTAFALKLDTWKLRSYEGFPHVINGDGLTMLRKTSSNDYEYRLQAYPTFSTRAPGWNGRVAV